MVERYDFVWTVWGSTDGTAFDPQVGSKNGFWSKSAISFGRFRGQQMERCLIHRWGPRTVFGRKVRFRLDGVGSTDGTVFDPQVGAQERFLVEKYDSPHVRLVATGIKVLKVVKDSRAGTIVFVVRGAFRPNHATMFGRNVGPKC